MILQRHELGSTGIMVSPVGLGCGGYSRLGMTSGGDIDHAADIVRHALDLGINFFDTARAYGTEEAVGKAISGRRDDVVISTKTLFMDRDTNYMPVDSLVDSLEKSLARIGTDHVDVFSLHGVTPERLASCVDRYAEGLQRQVELGKIRHIGITESFRQDPRHEMLAAAVSMDIFDVVMVGFNFLNSGARHEVFPGAIQHGVGTQVMHAVRRVLTRDELLQETIDQLITQGEIEPGISVRSLKFLDDTPGVNGLIDAAYRYCRHEPGVSVVLTGTGSKAHLSKNVEALLSPPLPDEVLSRLNEIFGSVWSASGD